MEWGLGYFLCMLLTGYACGIARIRDQFALFWLILMGPLGLGVAVGFALAETGKVHSHLLEQRARTKAMVSLKEEQEAKKTILEIDRELKALDK
jgi:uroporphyrinogen-III decarboxylase